MTENWKDIDKFPGYMISDLGRVKSLKKGGEMILGKRLSGMYKNYYAVALYNGDGYHPTNHRVHRLVAKYFIDNPENKPQVNHIDGNTFNNAVSNLEWCTASHNSRHAVENGLRPSVKGVDHHKAILSEKDVLSIRGKFKPKKYTQPMLAREFGVSKATIQAIIQRRNWSHI